MGAEDLTVQTDTDLRPVRVWMCAVGQCVTVGEVKQGH